MIFKKLLFGSVVLFFGTFLWSCEDLISNLPDNPDESGSGKLHYYLGYGYDVINSSYLNRGDVKVSHPIFNLQRMIKDSIIVSERVAVQDFQVSVGGSVSKFYKDRNAGLGINYANSVAGALFSGKFGFEFSYAMNENRIDSSSFLRGRSYSYTHDDYIKNATAENLLGYVTDNFAIDLQTKTASQILDQYGTHAFVRYYKGGALEFNYVYHGSSLTKDTDLKAALNASYAGIEGGASYSASEKGRELEENSTFHFYTYGGKSLNAFTLSELKSAYGEWLNSITNNADICGIGNFDQSFISVWDLAEASGYSSKAKELEDEFIRRAISQGKALLVKMITTDVYEKMTSGNDTYTFDKVAKNFPAEIEVYVLGAGGGGQGGLKSSGILDNYSGTGGAGGGGAAAYMKLVVEEPVSFSITVGKGGSGGNYMSTGLGASPQSGYSGGNGGKTSVSWSAKSLTINADGGMGGSGNGTDTYGGHGGAGDNSGLPNQSPLYKDGDVASGSKGTDGSLKTDVQTDGGAAATIKKGSVNPFGGGAGGVRQKGGNTTAAKNGGGGSGGYSENYGKVGGDGHVIIKVSYYVDENELAKARQNKRLVVK